MQVTFRYSSGRPTSQAFTIEFRSGSATGALLASPGLLGTGDWRTYHEITYNVDSGPTATASIAVVFRAGDGSDIADLDWIRFS
ncbi:carbohydrate-binding protein [Rhizocola hellebori]|uniref:carbohydrate-binding protein n=1 Tax=Rhizocola hellebori TaxID=1392758 RepID=UPI001941A2C1|nr:carbohydrate-binding protein [Rhizocola hellebori]